MNTMFVASKASIPRLGNALAPNSGRGKTKNLTARHMPSPRLDFLGLASGDAFVINLGGAGICRTILRTIGEFRSLSPDQRKSGEGPISIKN
jgi:hypothetical protein